VALTFCKFAQVTWHTGATVNTSILGWCCHSSVYKLIVILAGTAAAHTPMSVTYLHREDWG